MSAGTNWIYSNERGTNNRYLFWLFISKADHALLTTIEAIPAENVLPRRGLPRKPHFSDMIQHRAASLILIKYMV